MKAFKEQARGTPDVGSFWRNINNGLKWQVKSTHTTMGNTLRAEIAGNSKSQRSFTLLDWHESFSPISIEQMMEEMEVLKWLV